MKAHKVSALGSTSGLILLAHVALLIVLPTPASEWIQGSVGCLGCASAQSMAQPELANTVHELLDVRASIAVMECGLAVTPDGTVWGWGDYPEGDWNRSQPRRVAGLPYVSAIDVGAGNRMTLTSDGSVWTWGINRCGQLGDGTGASRDAPQ